MSEPKSVLDHALRYLALGWSVIPVDSRRKGGSPFAWAPYQQKRATEAEVRSWWGRWPDHGVAVVTGRISGVVGLDLDRHGEHDGVQVTKTLYDWEPEGPHAETGGGGLHAYLQWPGWPVSNRSGAAAVAPGVDLKGDAGFLYAPPSVHPSGKAYRWIIAPWEEPVPPMPDWLLAAVRKDGVAMLPPEQTALARQDDALAQAFEAGVGEGERNDAATRLAGRYLAFGLSEREVLALLRQWNARNRPPLNDGELEKVVSSIALREAVRRGDRVDELDEEGRSAALQVISERFGVPLDEIQWIDGSEPVLRFRCGKEIVDLPTKLSLRQQIWRSAVLAVTGRVPRLIKADWDRLLQQMVDVGRANRLDPGAEARDQGQLTEWLQDYLDVNPPKADGEETARPTDPVTRLGETWVHLATFRGYAQVEHGVRLKAQALAQQMRAAGMEPSTIRVKWGRGKTGTRNMWSVPQRFWRQEE